MPPGPGPGPGSVVPCVLMRAGTSRGPFFLREWLPADDRARDEALVGAIGASDELGLDGVGGGSTLTSKVAIVSRSDRADCDVDYLFAQVGVGRRSVDTTPNCGNMLAGVGPFAIEQGLVPADDPVTTVRIHNVNTGARIDATVQTPGARVDYAGDTRIDGVAGTAAPIRLDFLDAWGAVTGAVFPTGRRIDVIEVDGIGGVEVTCIDAAMPLMVVRARDLGVDGRAAPEQLDADATLRTRLESLRRTAGRLMGLGDVADRVVPKPVLVSAGDDDRPGPRRSVTSRYFTPHRCHTSHAATGAIGVATAFALPGTVADGAAGGHTGLPAGEHDVAVLHPQGRIDVTVQVDGTGAAASVTRAALVRTARKIFQGELHLPGYVFSTGVFSTGALSTGAHSTGAHSTAPAARAPAAAGPFPQRPLRLVVPTAAGGANDALARTVARRLGPLLGQTVVVDNRSGAGGSIACEHVAHAAPDGHTLLLGYVATHAMNPALQTVGYDPVADFTPVGLVGTSPTVLVTAAGSPFTTVAELVARLAVEPGGVCYASAGNGTAPHFAAELFALRTAPDTPGALRGVPHEGSAAALNATVTGRAEVMFASLAAAVAWIGSGALRALAVAGPHRAPALPDVPTLREAGVDGVEVAQWYGLFAPAATPGPVVDRLTAALDAVLTDAAAVRRLADLGVTTGPGTPDNLGALVRHELARWSAVVRNAGLRPDRGRVHRLLGA